MVASETLCAGISACVPSSLIADLEKYGLSDFGRAQEVAELIRVFRSAFSSSRRRLIYLLA